MSDEKKKPLKSFAVGGLSERPSEVFEMELDAVERGLLQTSVPMGGEVLVPQLDQREATPIGRLLLRDLAIELNKRHNIVTISVPRGRSQSRCLSRLRRYPTWFALASASSWVTFPRLNVWRFPW